MAVGWKSLAGIVGAASVVSVGTLYSVLVREPARPPSPLVGDAKPAVTANPPADKMQKPALTGEAVKPESARTAGSNTDVAKTEAAKVPATGNETAKSDPGKSDPGKPDPGKPDSGKTEAAQPGPVKTEAAKPQPPKPEAPKPDAAKGQTAPTFDIARIEPAGSAVIAGRAASGATVELLRNGNPYARVVADINGTWAITPPALPKGPCELTLRTTSPDGRVTLSEQTLSVRVPEKPGEEVVVVLNSPDQPSQVLTDAAPPTSKPPEQPAAPSPGGATASAEADKGSSRANVSIRTVEADEMGRFFVTGRAEPGAALRIYLNDTLVTGVTAAKDGTFGMTIEKGMQPGNYRVRVDDVAAANGQVLTRAEVPFAMVDKAPSASAPAVVAAIATPPRSGSTRGGQPAAMPPQAATTPSTAVPGAATPAPGDKTQPAAASAPAQGASPAIEPGTQGAGTTGAASPPAQAEAVPPASGNTVVPRSATTPSASNPATPATAPVQTSEAKPAQPSPPPSVAVIPEIRTTTILQGDNLWRISRKVYGQGIRYTWIYDANTDQIRNPNLIYPGQIFVMPDKKTP